MAPSASREIRLASRPHGFPTPENFSIASTEIGTPGDGQVLVRNLFMSVDPYMRGRMNEGESYIAPFEIGRVLEGGAIGEVVVSRTSELEPGTIVVSNCGWRECFLAGARELQPVNTKVEPLSALLGVLGLTGMTAWVGVGLADLKAGETVFVSGAAGAVGSVAGQLAKLRGCRVVGSAGSSEKVRLLLAELGFDAAFDYTRGHILGQLHRAAPEGVDVYFDNVGGVHLEAALTTMRVHGRVIACGAISTYNDEKPAPGPHNLPLIIAKRLTIRGFLVRDWSDRRPAFLAEVGPLLAKGKLKSRETVVEGIERAPQAFIDLLRGGNIGKMVVKLIPGSR
jgi:NADPH-dependent curcumin reductase CurA